jgi:catechol 2,3-dioxygenase-like lactoylglutathione lyase family enzyme
VTDIAKSIEHYRDMLGFTVTFEYETPTFYVCLCRDEVALHGSTLEDTSIGDCRLVALFAEKSLQAIFGV